MVKVAEHASIITSPEGKKKTNLPERLSAFCNKILNRIYASCEIF
jgi:hypothetical protein